MAPQPIVCSLAARFCAWSSLHPCYSSWPSLARVPAPLFPSVLCHLRICGCRSCFAHLDANFEKIVCRACVRACVRVLLPRNMFVACCPSAFRQSQRVLLPKRVSSRLNNLPPPLSLFPIPSQSFLFPFAPTPIGSICGSGLSAYISPLPNHIHTRTLHTRRHGNQQVLSFI